MIAETPCFVLAYSLKGMVSRPEMQKRKTAVFADQSDEKMSGAANPAPLSLNAIFGFLYCLQAVVMSLIFMA